MKKGRKSKRKSHAKISHPKTKKSKGLIKALQREKIAREKWRNSLQKLRELRQSFKAKIAKIKHDLKRKIKQAQETALAKAALKAIRHQEKRALAREKALQKAAMKFDKKFAAKTAKLMGKTKKGKRGRRGRPRKVHTAAMAAPHAAPKKKRRGRPRKRG